MVEGQEVQGLVVSDGHGDGSLWVSVVLRIDLPGAPGAADPGGREQVGQVVPEQVPDALDRDVRWRVRGQRLRVVRVMPLSRKDGRQARSPDFFHRVQDAKLVVHQNVMPSRVAILDVVQLPLLMDVDQDTAFDGLVQPGALDLPGLEDDIAVGQDDRLPPGLDPCDHVQRAREQAIGEGIGQQVEGNLQEVWIARVLGPIALQGAEVIRIAHLRRSSSKIVQ